MKKLAVLSILLLFVMSVAQTQAQTGPNESKKEIKKEVKKEKKNERKALRKLSGTEVSNYVKNAFYADFGRIPNVKFERKEFLDEATFTKDGQEQKAFYDVDGTLVGTTITKTFADVPADGQKFIKKNYKDYTVKQVIFYDDNEANDSDMILYGVQFADQDNYFVELTKDNKTIVVQVDMEGEVFFYKDLN